MYVSRKSSTFSYSGFLIVTLYTCLIPSADSYILESMSPMGLPNLNEDVRSGSEASYESSKATWTFRLRLRIPSWDLNKSVKPDFLYKIELEQVISFDDDDVSHWLLDQHFNERFQFTPKYKQDPEVESEANVTLHFDHAYTGRYKLRVKSCSDFNSCPRSVYETDLGLVTTPWVNLNANFLNINIDLKTRESGAAVEFSINYNNANSSNAYLEFKDFLVELNGTNNGKRFKIRTPWNRVEFRNCSADPTPADTADEGVDSLSTYEMGEHVAVCCIHNLPVDNYTAAVTPIDTRCNIRDVDVYLEPIQASRSSKTRICRRVSAKTLEILDHINVGDEDFPKLGTEQDESSSFLEPVLIGIFSLVLVLLVAAAIFLYVRRRQSRWPYQSIRLSRLGDLETANFRLLHPSHRVLFIYEMGNATLRSRALALRQQLKAAGITQIYDYAGEEELQLRDPCSTVADWFTRRIHDPETRILVIFSSGLLECREELFFGRPSRATKTDPQRHLLLYALDQLMAVAVVDKGNIHRRIFLIHYGIDDTDAIQPEVEDHLTTFPRYLLPGHFDLLLSHLKQH